jgi:hypothetical protein
VKPGAVPVVAVHGSYQTDNYGDLLLIALYARWVRELLPGARVVHPSPVRPARRWLPADDYGWDALVRARALVYTGGGYFGEPAGDITRWGRRNYRRHIPPGALAGMMGLPITINGVGVGPIEFKRYRRAVAALFRRARHSTVRDEESLAWLVEWGIDPGAARVTADAALTLDRGVLPPGATAEIRGRLAPGDGARLVGVHLPSRAPELAAPILAAFERLLGDDSALRLVVLRETVVGAPAPPGGSLGAAVLERFAARSIFLPYESPDGFTAVLGALDGIVTTQLHVGIVAAAFDVPLFSLARHPKTERLWRQLAAPWRCVPLDRLGGVDLSGLMARALAPLEPGSIMVPPPVRLAAWANRDALAAFLSETWPNP